MIDTDEFEYVLSEFNIPAKQCRSAYTMFSEVLTFLNRQKFANYS